MRILKVLIFLLAAAVPVTAQGTDALPPAVDMMIYSERPAGMYTVVSIHPVGWSRDGKFAYVEVHPVEGRGGTEISYRIIDAVWDTTVFSLVHDTFEEFEKQYAENGEADPLLEDDEVAYSVQQKWGEFADALRRHGIVEQTEIGLESLPFTSERRRYDARLETTPETNQDPDSYEFLIDKVRSFRLIAEADGLGSKTVTSSDEVTALNLWIAGFFRSPFEPRILIAVGSERFVFEGTEGFFDFYGCNLKVGYRR